MRNFILATCVALCTLVLSLLILRRLAPALVGVPIEVRVVQSSEAVPPFFAHVFSGVGTTELLRDPVTVVRDFGLQQETAGAGPTDLLGFRNRGIPNYADVVVIGDSQTYGAGARFADTWPQRLAALTGLRVYSMSANGWGPTQYVEMSRHAGRFRPRVVVVAYYTGNDPHDAFAQAYTNPVWEWLRVSQTLGPSDAPPAIWPVPETDRFHVVFRDGVTTTFTPGYRFSTNDRGQPGVREGYEIIAKSATVMARSLAGFQSRAVFTVIPTKEFVYAPKLRASHIEAPAIYDALVAAEEANIAELAASLKGMRTGIYIDVAGPLRTATDESVAVYPRDTDGHPNAAGHDVIARAIAIRLESLLR